MKTKTQHTPAPWFQNGEEVIAKNGGLIADCFDNNGSKEANAAFIVRAVNSHEALLKALKEISKMKQFSCECQDDCSCTYTTMQYIAEKAISQAEGK